MYTITKLILFSWFTVNCSNSQILINAVKNPITSDLKVQFPDIKIPETANPFNLSSFKGFDPFHSFDGKIFNPFQFDLEEIFKRFSKKFNRNYTVDDIPQRKENLLNSIKLIVKHIIDSTIGGQSSFNVGLTSLSDLSNDEYRKLLGSVEVLDSEKIIASRRRKRATSNSMCQSSAVSTSFPYAYDSRTKNIVTAVKSQNTNCQKVVTRQYRSGNSIITEYQTDCDSCGSCWAFATVATIETLWAKKTGQLIDLSEQDLVNCATSDGCNGAYQATAYQYVMKNGIARESDVLYKAKSSECKHYPLLNGVQISDYCEKGGKLNYTSKYENGRYVVKLGDVIPATDDELIRDVLEMGALATAINADDPHLKQYKSGIYDSSSCSKSTNHAVVVVGYGAENGKEYWIVKNSWDTTWGESGYIRVARNKNLCGINNHYYFPLITNTNVVNKLS